MVGRPLDVGLGPPPLPILGGKEGGKIFILEKSGAALEGSEKELWPTLGGLVREAVSVNHGENNGGVSDPNKVVAKEGAGEDEISHLRDGGSDSRKGKAIVPWSALFSSSSSIYGDGLKLSYVKPVLIDGVLAAKCPDVMVNKGLERWKNTLMGHFIGGRPSFTFARDVLLKQWKIAALSSIGSVIGKPIVTNKMTSSMERLSYARLCVEVFADRELPLTVSVYGEDGLAFNQKVVYDWKPSLCLQCKMFGHSSGDKAANSLNQNNKFGRTIFRKSDSNKEASYSNAFAVLENLTEEIHYDPDDLMLDPDSCAILLGNELLEDEDKEIEESTPQPLAIFPNLAEGGDKAISISSRGIIEASRSKGNVTKEGEISNSNGLDVNSNLNGPIKDPIVPSLEGESRERMAGSSLMGGLNLGNHLDIISESGAIMGEANLEGGSGGEQSSLKGKSSSQASKVSANFEKLKKQAAENRASQGNEKVVYASNLVEERRELWRDINTFVPNISSPWVAMGDFNIVRQQSEKLGGDLIRQEAVDEFNSFIFDIGLIDLKWKGEQSSEVTFLPLGLSDHSPTVVSTFDKVNFGPKPFRFFEAWIGREGFDDVIAKGWDCPVNLKLNPILRFAARLRNVKADLKNWNKSSVEDVFLLSLAAQPNDPSLVPLETEAKKKLWEALVIEEKFLKEKSRVKNIQLGDGNNGFFHKSMVCRQNRNHILEVHNAEIEIIKEPNLIKKEAVAFYMNLFGAEAEDVGYFPGSVPLRHGLDQEQ
ncbi:uncharacterized protein LOC122662943 [Telopea speciosissima]|uniref:uncharacterized protein LOC122662943 n=1 Tax=Telopea speciosissima TaxID=54955 RepID=UPI001CC445BE|nr:uncharacterized protein LOC122662943 [Telopea speciosissima]